jgi:hypothetical protein
MGSGTLPDFMARAVEQRAHGDRVDVTDEDEHEDPDHDTDTDQPTHQPPFWASSSAPMYPEGEPVVDPATLMISYRQAGSSTSAAGMHAPGTAGAVIAELQQQLAVARAQLDATRAAWRAERCRSLASREALTAVLASTGGVGADLVNAVATAAANAAFGLDDHQLADDNVAATAVRSAGTRVAGSMQAQQAQWPAPPREPYDEIARARARRRARSPRW